MLHELVIVGRDLAPELHRGYLPRRDGVVVVDRSERAATTAWQYAADLGADQVVQLPVGESWLIARLADIGIVRRERAQVVGFVSGSGGCGASSLAAAVAVLAVHRAITVTAIDLDPLGTGLELILGDDDPSGTGWNELAQTRGRLRGDTVRASLPEVAGVPILGWGNTSPASIAPGAVGSVIDGITTSCDLVVVDLPRQVGLTNPIDESQAQARSAGPIEPGDPAVGVVASLEEAVCRCDLIVVVCPRTSVGIAATSRLIARARFETARVQVVTIGTSSAAISAQAVAEVLQLPLLVDVSADNNVLRRIERGVPPVGRRGGLRTAGEAVLQAISSSRSTSQSAS
jgi:secretion/DNA translocation related CpaE-like protein